MHEHGLTLSDYEVRVLGLGRAPDRRLWTHSTSRSRCYSTPSGITRLLAGLERNGFVERVACESDARVSYAQLTPDGLGKLRAASKTHVEGIRSLFGEHFTAGELESLSELLGRLPVEAADDDACEA